MIRPSHFLLLSLLVMGTMCLPGASKAGVRSGNGRSEWAVPVSPGGPFSRVYLPQNAPVGDDSGFGAKSWLQMNQSPDHNASIDVLPNAPEWFRRGVFWRFAEARAWPLERGKSYGTAVYGETEAGAVQTQFYGNALGVSVAGGVVFAESDDMFAYALNARTGQLIWRTSPVGNHLMGNPLVAGRSVYLAAGGVGFNFSNVISFARTGSAVRGMDVSYNGIFALDRKTGRLLWSFKSVGEAMPTPAIHGDVLYFATGSGTVHALDRMTGRQLWKRRLGGNDNMSSPAYQKGRLYVAMAAPPRLYCLEAKSGRVLWKGTIPGAANTGMGDVSPAVGEGVVVMDTVTRPKVRHGQTTLRPVIRAFDAVTGRPIWTASTDRGAAPPAFKGGVPLIMKGVAYVGSPVTGAYVALDLHTGRRLWTWKRISAGRSAPTFHDGDLYIAGGDSLYRLNPRTGHETGRLKVGGRMGLVSPTIVGGTAYLANSWDWIVAVPLANVAPEHGILSTSGPAGMTESSLSPNRSFHKAVHNP